jgi:hypothetical protein
VASGKPLPANSSDQTKTWSEGIAIVVGIAVIGAGIAGAGIGAGVLPPAPPQAVRANKPNQRGIEESRVMVTFW